MKEDWTEKYRPQTLDDVIGNEAIVSQLKNMVEQNDLHSCIFSGPPGVGKTTCAVAIARDYHGDNWQTNFKELNASDARGIDVVREEVKEFSRQSREGRAILFLDEADALTDDAQAALRRVMEKYSSACVFILSCNYPSKIIPAIQSRCTVSRFSRVADEEIGLMLKDIIEEEGLKITQEAVNVILQDADGDVRSAVKILQAVSVLDEPIEEDDVIALTFNVPDEKVAIVLRAAGRGDFKSSLELLEQLINRYAASPEQIIEMFYDLSWEVGFSDQQRMRLVEGIGEAEYRINEGCDPYIQLSALLAAVAQMPD